MNRKVPSNILNKIENQKEDLNNNLKQKNKNNARFKMPDRRKGYTKNHRLVIIKCTCTQVNMMTGKLEKYL